MLIFTARSEESFLSETVQEAVDLCNRLAVGIDLTFEGAVIAVRPGVHPYNLIQAHLRATGTSSQGGGS